MENAAGHLPLLETCCTEKAGTCSLLTGQTQVCLSSGHPEGDSLLQLLWDKRKWVTSGPEEGHVWEKAGNCEVRMRKSSGRDPSWVGRGNRPGLQEWGERTQPYKDSEARWGGEASGSVWGGSGSLQANQRDFRCQVHWGQGALELGRTRAEATSWVILCDGSTVENDWVPTSLKGSLEREREYGARSLWKMWGAVHWVEIYKVWI